MRREYNVGREGDGGVLVERNYSIGGQGKRCAVRLFLVSVLCEYSHKVRLQGLHTLMEEVDVGVRKFQICLGSSCVAVAKGMPFCRERKASDVLSAMVNYRQLDDQHCCAVPSFAEFTGFQSGRFAIAVRRSAT